jgi:hypothetical protein
VVMIRGPEDVRLRGKKQNDQACGYDQRTWACEERSRTIKHVVMIGGCRETCYLIYTD